MRSLHLFAGGGGGLLADLLLGHRPVCAVEIDPNARAVLEARRADGWFPDLAEIHDDVRNFDGFKWRGRADIVAGGFPCQDISLAGNGAGLAGARSGLWWEMWRVIREVGPRYVYLENVAAITGRGMDQVLGALAQSGWDAEWLCLPASEVGAPHRRDRWWCLGRNPAHADSGRREQCHADHRCVPVTDAQRDAAHAHAGHEHAAQAVCAGRPAAVDGSDLPATDTGRSQRREQLPQVSEGKRMLPNSNGRRREQLRRTEPDAAERAAAECDGHAADADRDRERGLAGDAAMASAPCADGGPATAGRDAAGAEPRLGGAPDGLAGWLDRSARGYWSGDWETEPRVADRQPGRVARLRQLGNGQVPQCAAAAFRVLWQRLEQA